MTVKGEIYLKEFCVILNGYKAVSMRNFFLSYY